MGLEGGGLYIFATFDNPSFKPYNNKWKPCQTILINWELSICPNAPYSIQNLVTMTDLHLSSISWLKCCISHISWQREEYSQCPSPKYPERFIFGILPRSPPLVAEYFSCKMPCWQHLTSDDGVKYISVIVKMVSSDLCLVVNNKKRFSTQVCGKHFLI